MAYQVANVGDPRDAVLLANTAARGGATAGRVARTLLAERQAWAYSRAGDHANAVCALDRADELFDGGSERAGQRTARLHSLL